MTCSTHRRLCRYVGTSHDLCSLQRLVCLRSSSQIHEGRHLLFSDLDLTSTEIAVSDVADAKITEVGWTKLEKKSLNANAYRQGVGRPSEFATPLLMQEVKDSIHGPGKLDTMSPTARHRCHVSSELHCPNAKSQKWTPLVTRFGQTLQV